MKPPIDYLRIGDVTETPILSDAERERLAMLAEEAGEIVQVVGKILRHGFDNHHPATGVVNRDALRRELADIGAVAQMMIRAGDVKQTTREEAHEAQERKARWSRFQN